MIGTEFLPGQGLGNRLFCYVTARCLAADRRAAFGTAGQEYLQADFLALDLGDRIGDPERYRHYQEAEKRLYLRTSPHDMVHGCYIAGADEGLWSVEDDTLIYGNLQDERYFTRHRDDIRRWLTVRPEFELHEPGEHRCVINVRGGEYADDPALYLKVSYWKNAMRAMKAADPEVSFLIVTDDVEAARKLLPGIPALHGSVAEDYCRVKNARYLILSNSSFAFFPAYTSDTVQRVIAPKYWARHNVSDGYWASEQNIYTGFEYMDRSGKLFSAKECRQELQGYLRDRVPETTPYAEDDPEVEAVRRRCRRQMLIRKAERRIAGFVSSRL